MRTKKIKVTALLISLITFATYLHAAYAADGEVADKGQTIHKVNESIHLGNGERADELHSVNGSISVGDHAVITSAGTVNGSVSIGDDSQAQKLGTVNGSVTVGKRSVIAGDITSVNGHLELQDDAVVQGNAKNVNSNITLENRAHVIGQIITDNGDITLQDNARVDGGIRIKPGSSWFTDLFGDFFSFHIHKSVITIGPGAQVNGEMVFDRKVELRVHSTAKIGKVTGATVQRY